MKHLKAITCALFLLGLSACGPRPYNTNGPLAKGNTLSTSSTDQVTALGYEISDGTCTTGHREFTTQADLCLNLQIDANNNDCSQDSRMTYFAKVCSGQSFQPAAALGELKNRTGMYVQCDFTSTDLTSKVAMTIHQETSAGSMTILLGSAKAYVSQSLKDGVYGVSVRMAANDGSGSARKTLGAINSAPAALAINSTSSSATLHLDCTTSLESVR